ncbi:MAG: hypothetical protein M5U34_41975 [Chloroflexi bacterium]|nr:hypothetical protein [Chloroflexota bacterium]
MVIPGVEETAVTPTITPESSNDNPPETAPSSPTTEPESRKWPLYSGVILLVLLGAALAAYLGAQAFNQTANRPLSPTLTLFPEEAIGQSQWFTTRPLTTPLSDDGSGLSGTRHIPHRRRNGNGRHPIGQPL